ncbi:diaminopropionate ammonia-lyase [Saccharopolyspora erythraea NRRL 2338]|uniref:Pyridoxal-5'-phosphate-dependent enzyme, beta subunit n=2 Tax=Saccharopolyspora erythraea TaxID=1836 RepID=A4FJB2_SACEN|nr:diaminopropionate ammonia-lyase [Saccharopolyspora erythraea]EQD85372.1 pyridoxal-5'-phosphate-dependent protein subunit beta [Saccharopolyspora erythraea D]PFG97806.1 diaminopropionate ammonia-lyase [Saccharopolyspora erythraea NRRL 2338]QRK87945.1 diaminopropionate ammonia-lyase [Saccharopolyspora erythraea]CAM04137.1 pyridoxal-5'-phosphate-dependent enzyme, beta subunit [Saccharopolyspora erythraea NRRL 2338]
MTTDHRACELFFNDNALRVIEGISADRAPLEFHQRMPDYARTPLLDCPPLADDLGVARLWVKDESTRLGLMSFKVLGASYAIYRTLCDRLGAEPEWRDVDELRRELRPLAPMTLAAATDGNHGLAVAHMARLLGFSARVYVPADMVVARIEAIEAEDAVVTVVDGDYDDAVRRSAEDESDECIVVADTSWPGYENIPWSVIEGYSTIFWETDDELRERGAAQPDVVAVPIGVGALAAATVRHYRRPDAVATPRLIGVEPLPSASVLESLRARRRVTVPGPHESIMAGLRCGTPSALAWPLLRDGIDVLAAIDDAYACEAMRSLAAVGVVAGETGAAALGALRAVVEKSGRGGELPSDASVLVVVTEGATDPQTYARIVTAGGSDS